MVNILYCRCSLIPHKVREKFLDICWKVQYLYFKTWIDLNFLFSYCFLKLFVVVVVVLKTFFELLLRGQVQSSKINDCSCISSFIWRSKELHKVKSSWSAQRSFNWQQSNSYVMLQPTDLLCHKIIIFAKSNILISLNQLSRKYWGDTYSHLIFQWESSYCPHYSLFYMRD